MKGHVYCTWSSFEVPSGKHPWDLHLRGGQPHALPVCVGHIPHHPRQPVPVVGCLPSPSHKYARVAESSTPLLLAHNGREWSDPTQTDKQTTDRSAHLVYHITDLQASIPLCYPTFQELQRSRACEHTHRPTLWPSSLTSIT